jgi:hypothetical protein
MRHLLLALLAIAPLSACSECDALQPIAKDSYKGRVVRSVEIDCITHNIRGILKSLAEEAQEDPEFKAALLRQIDEEIKMIRFLMGIE